MRGMRMRLVSGTIPEECGGDCMCVGGGMGGGTRGDGANEGQI